MAQIQSETKEDSNTINANLRGMGRVFAKCIAEGVPLPSTLSMSAIRPWEDLSFDMFKFEDLVLLDESLLISSPPRSGRVCEPILANPDHNAF